VTATACAAIFPADALQVIVTELLLNAPPLYGAYQTSV
jgi:hypothetical protein